MANAGGSANVRTTAVIEDANWRGRVHSEHLASKLWSQDWGFLRETGEKDSLEMTGRKAIADGSAATHERHMPVREAGGGSNPRLQLTTYMTTTQRQQYDLKKPQEAYTAPVTTSQNIGWRSSNTLEVFGPNLQCRLR